MNLMTYDQRIDAVVEEYRSDAPQDNKYLVTQVEKIQGILSQIQEHKWDHEPSVEWDKLLECMVAWSKAWDSKLLNMDATQPVEDLDGTVRHVVVIPRQPPEDVLARFRLEQWTEQFIRYADRFYDSVQNFFHRLQHLTEQQRSRGRKRGRLSYTDMQQNYLQLLQYVYDVPAIDDRQRMHYQKKHEDPSDIQALVQDDDAFTEILELAGVCVLWALDDMLDPEAADLPPLFDDDYYDRIFQKLRPVTPETQEMHVQVDETHDEVDGIHDEVDEIPESPLSPQLQMTSLLHQLQHMCHRG
jgi:hypothetical protein